MLEQMGRRDINRFLRHMWVSKYGDLKSQDLFTALKARIENDNIGSMGLPVTAQKNARDMLNCWTWTKSISKTARFRTSEVCCAF